MNINLIAKRHCEKALADEAISTLLWIATPPTVARNDINYFLQFLNCHEGYL
jgi:hypothetical protein